MGEERGEAYNNLIKSICFLMNKQPNRGLLIGRQSLSMPAGIYSSIAAREFTSKMVYSYD